MPYRISKANGWRVTSPHGTKAKSTSFQKAQAQASLLRGIKHGFKPTGAPATRKYKKKAVGAHARKMLGKK